VSATQVGTFLGIEPTGNRIRMEGATFSRFGDDGLVVRDVNFWDVPGLLGPARRLTRANLTGGPC
jgi:hypothetical protein